MPGERELAEPPAEAPRTPAPTGAEPPQPKPPSSRRKLKKWGLIALLVIVAAGVWWWLSTRNKESTDDAQVNGYIHPISPRVSGSVIQVLVDNGYQVRAGQALVRLDPRDYEARVNQLKGALAEAIARANAAQVTVPLTRTTTTTSVSGAAQQLTAAEDDYRGAEVAARQAETSGIATAEANVAQAEANNRKAQADLARMRPLVAKEEISQQQFDAYLDAAEVAAAQLRSARDQLTAARQTAQDKRDAAAAALARVGQARANLQQSQGNQRQVQVSAAQEQSAQAAVKQARANLAAAELNLSYTVIYAPVAGEVDNRTVETGESVQPGQGLMTVIPLYNTYVIADFKETQLAHVHRGDYAEVHVDTYGRSFRGRVDSILPATGAITSLLPPENATGNFVKVVQRIPVKIVFDHLPPGVALRPGMNVEATVYTK